MELWGRRAVNEGRSGEWEEGAEGFDDKVSGPSVTSVWLPHDMGLLRKFHTCGYTQKAKKYGQDIVVCPVGILRGSACSK